MRVCSDGARCGEVPVLRRILLHRRCTVLSWSFGGFSSRVTTPDAAIYAGQHRPAHAWAPAEPTPTDGLSSEALLGGGA
jgi:hypothetical protein